MNNEVKFSNIRAAIENIIESAATRSTLLLAVQADENFVALALAERLTSLTKATEAIVNFQKGVEASQRIDPTPTAEVDDKFPNE